MPRKPLSAAEAAVWATLGYVAKLFLKKADIKKGEYRVDCRVVGTCAGYPIDLPILGLGTQSGPQTTAGSTGPGVDELWAYARQHIPATRLAEIESQAKALWTAEGRLPCVEEADAKDAGLWLKQCRAATSGTKAGAFTFAADPDPEELAGAMSREAA